MMRLKDELCPVLLYKNHPLFQLADKGLLNRIKTGVYGNLLDPCPLKVCMECIADLRDIRKRKNTHRDIDSFFQEPPIQMTMPTIFP